jgi:hypothetical protein
MLDLIKEINEGGFLISNLFQLTSTRWRANLRTIGDGATPLFFDFGEGSSPYEALLSAYSKMGPGVEARASNPKAFTGGWQAEQKRAGADLLASLGLKKKSSPIKLAARKKVEEELAQ